MLLRTKKYVYTAKKNTKIVKDKNKYTLLVRSAYSNDFYIIEENITTLEKAKLEQKLYIQLLNN